MARQSAPGPLVKLPQHRRRLAEAEVAALSQNDELHAGRIDGAIVSGYRTACWRTGRHGE
jgi:hypothetical protein